MPTAAEIFWVFLHLGVTAYGGLAMIEPMRRRVVDEKKWLDQREFLDGVALCQVVPGATVVQLATYVGQRLRGTLGALAGALGFILPAFFLMLGLSWLYGRYGDLSIVKTLSRGLNAVVIALLLQALWRLGKGLIGHWQDLLVAAAALAALGLGANYLAVFCGAGFLRLALRPPNPGTEEPQPAAISGAGGEAGPEMRAVLFTLITAGAVIGILWLVSPLLAKMAGIMFKVGLISFGGGYVMIPVLQWDVVDSLKWLTLRQFLDGILLGYVTPGPLIIMAAFVGYVISGVGGAAVATVFIFLPPILIIMALAPYYQRVKEARWMRPLIQGILAALVGMLALVTVQMGLGAITDWQSLALMAGAAVALLVFEVNLLLVIAGAAALSLVML
jgi:chromate transporter